MPSWKMTDVVRPAPLFRMAAAFFLVAAVGSPHAALTFPGCADLDTSQFVMKDLVGRATAGSPNAKVIDPTLLEPLMIHVHTDGRVYWTERTNTGTTPGGGTGATSAVGRLRVFRPGDSTVKTVQSFNVSTVSNNGVAGQNTEYGLRSFTMDPNFATNGYAYVMYNPRTTVSGRDVDTMLVSRFTMPTPDTLDLASEKKLLKIPFTLGICCHQGGAMDWDAQGNLYVSIGNNTENGDSPIYMRDTLLGTTGENKDRATRDNPARVANTMDWRGKIVRIKPDNSTRGYSIPAGNYRQRFLQLGGAWVAGEDTNKILPEIYVVGSRSPFTISVDKPTGNLFFGDVGPDNGTASTNGPIARDEWNIVKEAGFFGFPYFVGVQQAYNMWNPATKSYNLPPQKVDSVYNNSPNNTGVARLTRAMPPLLAMCHNTTGPSCNGNPYNMNVGSVSSAAASAGPYFRYNNTLATNGKQLPPHFNNKWIVYESTRHWVQFATLNANADSVSALDTIAGLRQMMRGNGSYGLIDMKIGPHDGALYVAGYNAANFASSNNTRISVLQYKGTCTGPVGVVPASPEARTRSLMQGILFAPGAGRLAWPEGMNRAEAFDLQGKRVFSFSRTPGEENVAIPQGLASGLLRVRFAP
jgi:cytochrome c